MVGQATVVPGAFFCTGPTIRFWPAHGGQSMDVGVRSAKVVAVPVDNHAHVYQNLNAPLCKAHLLVWSQFCGNAELDLSTDLGILTPFRRLSRIPKAGPVLHPLGSPRRKTDAGEVDMALPGVVEDFPRALVDQAAPCPVGRRPRCGATTGAADDLKAGVEEGHGAGLLGARGGSPGELGHCPAMYL